MIVAFEGLDGSGKGTQSQILSAKMSAKGIDNALYSFPNYKGTNFGLEVGKYLNGGFGSLDEVPPQFPVMLYAMDRFEMRKSIMKDINSGSNIIFDRYVPSNIAHQAVKFPENQRKTFADWVKRLEYNILEMPSPDVIIFLDVDPVIAGRMVALKGKRSYTDAAKDMELKELSLVANPTSAADATKQYMEIAGIEVPKSDAEYTFAYNVHN